MGDARPVFRSARSIHGNDVASSRGEARRCESAKEVRSLRARPKGLCVGCGVVVAVIGLAGMANSDVNGGHRRIYESATVSE